MSRLKISFVTDIHNGPNVGSNYGSKAVRLTEKFVEATNKFQPNFAVEMGDRISGRKDDDDRARMTELREVFNDLACPLHTVDGNHDLKNLDAEEVSDIMGQPKDSYSIDEDGFHIVFWKTDVSQYYNSGLKITKDELEWLEQDLASTDKPTIIVTHVPLTDKKGGQDTDNNPNKRFMYANANKARKIIEKSGNVVLCMAGHRHSNTHEEINGTHYITLQSLVQGQRGEGKRSPHGTFAFAELDSEERTIEINLQGKYKKNYSLTF